MGLVELLTNSFTMEAGSLFLHLATAAIIIILGFVFGKIIGRLVGKFIEGMKLNDFLSSTGVNVKADEIADRVVRYIIYALAFLIAMGQLGFTSFMLNIFYVAVVVVVLLAVLLSIKDFVPNLIAGFHLQNRKYFNVGDHIRVNGAAGKVLSVDAIETRVEAVDGNIIIIPNSYIVKRTVIVKKKWKHLNTC